MIVLKAIVRFLVTLIMLTAGSAFFVFNGILAILAGVLRWDTGIWLVSRLWSYGTFIMLMKRVSIKGKENIHNDRPFIVLANHASQFDIMALYLFTPRAVAWLAKGSLFKAPVMGWVLSSIGSIAIDRENARNTQKNIQARLDKTRQQKWIAIFPEGTRTDDGRIQDMKKGFIKVMRIKEMDLLPVTLSGFYGFHPKKGQLFINPFVPLEINIHPPLNYSDLKDLPDREIQEKIKTILETGYYSGKEGK